MRYSVQTNLLLVERLHLHCDARHLVYLTQWLLSSLPSSVVRELNPFQYVFLFIGPSSNFATLPCHGGAFILNAQLPVEFILVYRLLLSSFLFFFRFVHLERNWPTKLHYTTLLFLFVALLLLLSLICVLSSPPLPPRCVQYHNLSVWGLFCCCASFHRDQMNRAKKISPSLFTRCCKYVNLLRGLRRDN